MADPAPSSGIRVASATAPVAPKPRLRGLIHFYAFFASLIAGTILLVLSGGGVGPTIYAVTLSTLLGTSALYHRVDWSPGIEPWIRRLDHSMIFLLIAGSYTPFGVGVLTSPTARTILVVIWIFACAGILFKLVWIHAHHWVVAGVYLVMGWLGVLVLPDLVAAIGWFGTGLLVCGGLAYTAGATIYALRRPNPLPHWFGFHEVFHTLVIVGAGLHFAAVLVYAVD